MKEIPFIAVRLVRENVRQFPSNKICNAEDAFKIVNEVIGDADRETLLVILMGVQENIIAIHTAGIGSLDSQAINPREIFKAGILANAHHIILAHNHPSGSCKPSGKDIFMTRNLRLAGELLGIQVMDHIIVGNGTYTSLRDLGMLKD